MASGTYSAPGTSPTRAATRRPNGSRSTTTPGSGLPPNSPIRLDRSSRKISLPMPGEGDPGVSVHDEPDRDVVRFATSRRADGEGVRAAGRPTAGVHGEH